MMVNITCIISLVYMSGAFTITILQILIDLILEQFYNEDTVNNTLLQMRKLSHREGKQLPQRHTVRGRAQIPTESVKLLTTEPHGLLTPWPQLHRQQCCYMRQHAPVLPGTQRYEAEQDLGEAWEQGPQWPLDQDSGADGVSQKVLLTWTHQAHPGSNRPWICSGETGAGVPGTQVSSS